MWEHREIFFTRSFYSNRKSSSMLVTSFCQRISWFMIAAWHIVQNFLRALFLFLAITLLFSLSSQKKQRKPENIHRLNSKHALTLIDSTMCNRYFSYYITRPLAPSPITSSFDFVRIMLFLSLYTICASIFHRRFCVVWSPQTRPNALKSTSFIVSQ